MRAPLRMVLHMHGKADGDDYNDSADDDNDENDLRASLRFQYLRLAAVGPRYPAQLK